MNATIEQKTRLIKEKALEIGFSACGICEATAISEDVRDAYETWLEKGFHGSLDYLERNLDKRLNPSLLVEDAKSIISVALNYYPDRKLPENVPQFAYYAYGKDYHEVVKGKLHILFDFVKSLFPTVSGRCFSDSAPVLETYWATRAGIGFKGRNSLLIVPRQGSFFFLGELIIDQKLSYDSPIEKSFCGNCRKCVDACPTGAILQEGGVDASKCLSYHTIESKSEIMDEAIAKKLSNQVYGCDICQKVCPWNKFSIPHSTVDFLPTEEFLQLTSEKLKTITEEDFRRIFKNSAVKRAKFKGLKRNIQALERMDDE